MASKKFYWGLAIMIVVFVAFQVYLHVDIKSFKEELEAGRIKTETPTTPDIASEKKPTAGNTSSAAPNPPELPQRKEIVTSGGRIFFKDGRLFFRGKVPPKMTPELLAELGLLSQDEIISPYGFGPYPELPEGFGPITWPRDDPNDELMIRMEIELLNQGVPVEGIAMENGLIYPIIKGVRYVRWGETSDGRQYLRDQLGHPDDREYMNIIEAEKSAAGESETAADFPEMQLIPMEEGGIDPYTFLNLQK